MNAPPTGFRMPAEWEHHDAIWLSWPHDPLTFPGLVPEVEETYIEIIRAIHESERVNLFVLSEDKKSEIASRLARAGVDIRKVTFWVHEYADVWFRDYGPIFVVDADRHSLAMTHWVFNAWGGKYETLMNDTRIPNVINEKLLLPRFAPGIVLEGGSIDVDGSGTLLTTEQCLLNANRNPSLSRVDIESCLMNYLGVKKVLWLHEGVSGDDTDGHIDDIARFVGPAKVLCAVEDDPTDENHDPLRENFELLTRSTDCNGTPLQVIPLPMPGFVGDSEGRLPASYANFYIGNTVVLAPVFNHTNDVKAIETIQSVFPNRKVVGIDCRNLVHGLGTIHCISQQQPSVNG